MTSQTTPKRKPRPQPPECWACGTACPTGTRVAAAGWRKRVVLTLGIPLVELYCPVCFAQWGWPSVPECRTE